jgi:ABC-type molybdate transport system permease subunit
MGQTSIDYKAVLADLRERHARLETAISAVEGILGESSHKVQAAAKDHVRGQGIVFETPHAPYAEMTIAGAAMDFLQSVGKPQGTTEIVAALRRGGTRTASKNLYRTVYNSLNTKLDKGQITKIGRKWGLAEWQPK